MRPTHFLNVDLDIYSERDLTPLVNRLRPNVDVLYLGEERGKYSAHLEVNKITRTADSMIQAFCNLINDLPERERAMWDSAKVRSFSVGVQAGRKPNARDFKISARTVKAVTSVNAEIVFTIYGTGVVG